MLVPSLSRRIAPRYPPQLRWSGRRPAPPAERLQRRRVSRRLRRPQSDCAASSCPISELLCRGPGRRLGQARTAGHGSPGDPPRRRQSTGGPRPLDQLNDGLVCVGVRRHECSLQAVVRVGAPFSSPGCTSAGCQVRRNRAWGGGAVGVDAPRSRRSRLAQPPVAPLAATRAPSTSSCSLSPTTRLRRPGNLWRYARRRWREGKQR